MRRSSVRPDRSQPLLRTERPRLVLVVLPAASDHQLLMDLLRRQSDNFTVDFFRAL